ILLAAFDELGEVVVERCVDHGIDCGRDVAHCVNIVERRAQNLCSHRRQRGGLGGVTSHAGHLMAGGEQLLNNGGTHPTGGASNENMHCESPEEWRFEPAPKQTRLIIRVMTGEYD